MRKKILKIMATLQLYHKITNANPGLLAKIEAYFGSMFVFDEQEDFTVYQVEMPEKIGNIQIVLDFTITDSGVVVSGHRPA
jgi:hypothetical protein